MTKFQGPDTAAEPDRWSARKVARLPMFGWYDPVEIAKTGIRVGVASIFGEFFDRRELMAKTVATGATITQDYVVDGPLAPDGSLWLDFTADTGDGYWSTHTVARLMARPELTVAGIDVTGARTAPVTLPRAQALVFGGDQVYPTASREAYRLRLNEPFREANRIETGSADLDGHHVYAVPGNHDWYDGLTAFMGLFCARTDDGRYGRDVCGRHTLQQRSYFALRLPGDWWLVGADIQLSGYIDRGQIEYLGRLARSLPDGANLILITGQPSWAQVGIDGPPEDVFRNYAFLEALVTGAVDVDTFDQATPRHALRLVLSGDSHHYAHYVERADAAPSWTSAADRTDVRHFFTCGLGGSFLHPTHHLDPAGTRFEWPFPAPPPVAAAPGSGRSTRVFDRVAVYPSDRQSRMLTWGNLFFGILNLKFVAAIAMIAAIAAWALAGTVAATGPDLTRQITPDMRWDQAVAALAWTILTYPWGLVVVALLAIGLTKFTGLRNRWLAGLIGTAHASLHVMAFVAVTVTAARYAPFGAVPFVLGAWAAAGMAVLSSVIFGLYLLVSLNGFGHHWNEAFSSLKIEKFKGFLRMQIKPDGTLTIWPVVIDQVPRGDGAVLHPRLAEAPVTIRGTRVSLPT
jgi:3',5'-cyclic AMP phosphodiesterase CpdA